MQELRPELSPNGTIGPQSPLQRWQGLGMNYQPIRRAKSIIDFIADLAGPPETMLGNIGVGGKAAGVVPFIKKKGASALENLIPALNAELNKASRLGFDWLNEARRAILDHPDWASRWDVADNPLLVEYGDTYRKLVENQKNLERLGLAPELYTEPTIMEILRDSWGAKAPTIAPALPPTPSNVVPFSPKGTLK